MNVWTRQESKERFPKPISPLGWSLIRVPLIASLDQMSKTLGTKKYNPEEMILCYQNYIYTRKNFFSDLRNIKITLFSALRFFYFSLIVLLSWFKNLGYSFSFKNFYAIRMFRHLFKKELVNLIQNWPKEVDSLKNMMGRNYFLSNIKTMTYETFHSIRLQMQEDSKKFFAQDFNVYFLKKMTFDILKSLLIYKGIEKKKAEEFLSNLANGLPGNYSIVMIEDFANDSLNSEELKNRYGHLTSNWDLYAPTLAEQVEFWNQNKSLFKSKPKPQTPSPDIFQLFSKEPEILEMTNWLKKLILMDEDLRAYSSLQYPQARKMMNLVESVEAWIVTKLPPLSVYFLTLEEIEDGLKNHDFKKFQFQLQARKSDFENAQKNEPEFELTEKNGTFHFINKEKSNDSFSDSQTLRGTMVSSGSTEGQVIFINTDSDLSKVTKQSIIVIESATPVYAPFYMGCGGIISEMGGHLSHGAIVAREYGIPMLTAIPNVCSLLKEGQKIFLNADQETVKILK